MERAERLSFIFSHFALFIVFVWFGALKLFGLSPADPLVTDLFERTLGLFIPLLDADTFIIILGGIEVLIGLLFLIPRMEKAAIIILVPHMLTTIMPLFLAPEIAWAGPLVPTLEGQYMIKNIVIIALVAALCADLDKRRAA